MPSSLLLAEVLDKMTSASDATLLALFTAALVLVPGCWRYWATLPAMALCVWVNLELLWPGDEMLVQGALREEGASYFVRIYAAYNLPIAAAWAVLPLLHRALRTGAWTQCRADLPMSRSG